MSENISQEQLDNMGSLEGYLSERPYQMGTVLMTDDDRIVRDEGQYAPEGAPSQPPYAAPGVAPASQQRVVPPQTAPAQPVQSGISQAQYQAAMAYAHRAEQAAQQLARENIEIEEQAFLAQISHMSEEDQDVLITRRHNQQLMAANQAMAEAIAREDAQSDASEEQENKAKVAMILSLRAGLPWDQADVRKRVLRADSIEEMSDEIRFLGQMYPQQQRAQQQQQTQAQVAAGAYAAAPGRGSAPAARAIKPGSGDMSGYLKSKPYQLG